MLMARDAKIVLASGSAARRAMLEAAGIEFEVEPLVGRRRGCADGSGRCRAG